MQKHVVLCMSMGTKYPDEYVYKLQSMVSRFIRTPYDFVCVSDRLIKGVTCIPIEGDPHYPIVWNKISLLDHSQINPYNTKLFFDLDLVIHDYVDILFELAPPKGVALVRSRWKNDDASFRPGNTGINSSIMVWKEASSIPSLFSTNTQKYTQIYGGIDRFIWNECADWVTLPPHLVYSYREGATRTDLSPRKYRPEYRLCIYNQQPKPHESVEDEPAKSFWK